MGEEAWQRATVRFTAGGEGGLEASRLQQASQGTAHDVSRQAATLLSQLTPEDISGDLPDVKALREAGINLFGRAVLHALAPCPGVPEAAP